jgi:AAA domain
MSNPYPLLSLDEFFTLRVPAREWLVEGILVRGESGMLTAREKAGKGLLVIDLMACIANEEPFLGRAVSPCNVAYFAAEESIITIRERIAERLGTNREPPFRVLPINTVIVEGEDPITFKLTERLDIQRLIDTIKAFDLGLVVLDTFREMHDLPENESDYMAPLLKPLRQISHDEHVTILTNHHQNRQNTARGSTSIIGAVDFEWSFVRTDDDDAPLPAGRLTYKGRQPKQSVHIAFGAGGRWQPADPVNLVADASVRDHILTMLAACKEWLTAKEIAARLTAPNYQLKTIQNTLSQMVQERPCPVAFQRRAGRGGGREFHCLALRFGESDEASQPSGNVGKESSVRHTSTRTATAQRRAARTTAPSTTPGFASPA